MGQSEIPQVEQTKCESRNRFSKRLEIVLHVRHTCQYRLLYTQNDMIPELVVLEEPQDDKRARVTSIAHVYVLLKQA